MVPRHKFLFQIIFFIIFSNIALSEVTVSIGNVSVDGYTEDIVVPVTLSNPSETVGGLQFDIIAMPTIINLSDVTPNNENDFSADFSILDDGSSRIVFYTNTGEGVLSGGEEVVLNLHYNGMDVLSALVDLEAYNLIASDLDGNVIGGNIVSGSITIGDVVFLSSDNPATGDILEQVSVDISLQNSSPVGGVQFDIYDTPNYLDVTGFTTTNRTDGFQIDFNELANGGTRVIFYSPDNQNITSGSGPIANMEMVIHENAYNSNVGINFENITITDDIGGAYYVAGVDSGTVTVTPGYIEEPNSLSADGGLDGQVLLSWNPPIGPISSRPVTIYITTDTWGSETTWQLSNDETGDIVQSYIDAALENETEYSWDFDLDFGSYTFTIFDSWGDGIFAPGGYAVYIDSEEVFSNIGTGWAGAEESFQFEVSQGTFVVTNRSYVGQLPDKTNIPFQDTQDMDLPLGPPIIIQTGSFAQWGGNPSFNQRPVDLDGFKVYKSLDQTLNFSELVEVASNVTSYLDEDVLNSTTYYYYVTAIYPDGSESGPTSTVSATPVEWVELWMDEGASLSGQMDTIDFYINNESDIGLFYFEIMDYPNVMNSLNIFSTDRTSNWALEIADQGDGTIAITGISLGTPLAPGDGSVCRAVLYPVAEEEMTVNLSYTSGTSIQDAGFIDLNWTSENSTYEVGVETQYLNLYGGYGNPGTETIGSVFLQNTQPIYAFQFDILANPPFIMGVDLNFNEILNLENWAYSGTDLGTGYRVTAYDNSMTSPIEPGVGHLVDITYEIFAGVPDSTIVDITIGDAALADINNLPMHTEGTPHSFFVGQPSVGCTIENVSGELSPGGIGTFEIHMENIETVNILEFTILDMPDYMTVTNIELLGRFEDGTVVGESGENIDGSFYFLGYDPITFIEPGSGPIIEVEVQFNNSLNNPSVVFMFDEISAGDANALPLNIVADNFGQFVNTTLSIDQNITPGEFKLYANYPNPFNPATIITYDLAEASAVELSVFDMRGRKIKNLFSGQQNPGQYYSTWTGVDDYGKNVSAGVYIYKLKVSDKVLSRKMIMIK